MGWRLLLSLPGRDGGEHGEDGNAGCRKRRKKHAAVCGPPHTPAMELAARADAGRVAANRPACKYSWYWIGDDLIDTASTLTLAQIRARSTSSSPAISPRQSTTEIHMAPKVISVTAKVY